MKKAFIYYYIMVFLLLLYSILMIYGSLYPDYTVRQVEGNRLLIETSGYHDILKFMVRKSPSGAFSDFKLLESFESPLYASREDIAAYFARLEGSALEKLNEVDGITGATITSEAIRNALHGFSTSPLLRWKEMTLFVLLWASVILTSILKKHRLLVILSSLCFVIIGVIYNSPVGIYSLFSLTNSFHLLPLLALMSVLLYKNVYCAHICPFGFLQRIAGRLPIKKRCSPAPVLRSGKYILLIVALASLLMGNQLILEPYAYLFSRKFVWWIYLLPLAMLGISLFIPRFWCRLFCPMGALMQIGREIKKWAFKGRPPRISLPADRGRGALWLPLLPFGIILFSNVMLYLLL